MIDYASLQNYNKQLSNINHELRIKLYNVTEERDQAQSTCKVTCMNMIERNIIIWIKKMKSKKEWKFIISVKNEIKLVSPSKIQ